MEHACTRGCPKAGQTLRSAFLTQEAVEFRSEHAERGGVHGSSAIAGLAVAGEELLGQGACLLALGGAQAEQQLLIGLGRAWDEARCPPHYPEVARVGRRQPRI